MTGREKARYKVISMIMVAGFIFSFFAGSIPAAAQTQANGIAGTGDLYVGLGDEFVIDGYTHYMDGNVTVDGGTLEITNGSLAFLQDENHIYHMAVINGGKVIMNNGSITDHLDQIHTYPYVRMSVADSEVIMLNKSSLAFPGWLNITGSNFNMTESNITSIDDSLIDTYVGDHINTADGDNANDCPIIEFHSSQVYLYDSSISHLFEYKRGDANFHSNNFNLTLSGDTNFTAVNSYISIDLSNITDSFGSVNSAHVKNFLVLEDTANAYLYGVSIDERNTPSDLTRRDTAFELNGTGAAYLFRWVNYTILDSNKLPVPGAGLSSLEITSGSAPVEYPSAHGTLNAPPAEVLKYLGKTASNYNVTDERGEAQIPYLSDILLPDSKPKSDFVGNYRTYSNYTDSTSHTSNKSFSFMPYPSFNASVAVTISMPDLTLPLPELYVSSMGTTPIQIFEGDNVTLTAVVNNSGGSNAVNVVVSFYDGNDYVNSTIIPVVPAGGSETASIVWNHTWTKAGPHVINVTVDPDMLITEENEGNNTYLQQVNVGTRLPDFSVQQTDITSNPTTPYAGNDFTVSAVVHNVGDVDAQNIRVAFYNGTPDSNGDHIVDLGADLLGTAIVFVAASSQTTANITLSFDIDGTYDIYVWVDPDNTTEEYSYTNNLAYNSITVLPKPNLETADSDISFSDSFPDLGQSVTISATIHNTGALAVSDDFDIYFFLDNNDSSSIIGIFSYKVVSSGNIAPGASIVATVSWTAYPAGEHTILVSVNSNRTVDESTYSDNSASLSLTVMRTDDTDLIVNDTHYGHLTIDFDYSLSGYILVEENGVLEINNSTFTVSQQKDNQYYIVLRNNAVLYINDSTLASNYDIKLSLYDNAKLVVCGSTVESRITTIAHDSSSILLENSKVKDSVEFPDADSTVVMEASNTTFYQTFSVVNGYTKLALTNVELPKTATPIILSDHSIARIYRWLKVSAVDGTGHALGNVTVGSYFPLNLTSWQSAVTDENGKCLISLLSDTLYGDGSHDIVGGYLVNGSYTFQGKTYYSEDIHVSPNNYPVMRNLQESQYQSIEMKFDSLKPDLDPPVSVSKSNPVLGIDTIYVNSTVSNIGTAPAYNVDVRFYDNQISIGDVYIDELGVGESYDCSILWKVDGPVGLHNISVRVDPYNQIPELNESNNVGWTTLNVTGWPDLTLSSGDISFLTQGSTMRGGVVTVSATIHNQGDSASETTQVAFYDGNPEAGGTQFAIDNIDSIPIEGASTISVEWIPDTAGNHYIYVVIDPDHNLNETNEDNNIAYKEIYVQDYPDLYITSMTFQFQPDIYGDANAGDSVNIAVIVGNGGQSPAANVVVDLFDITGGGHSAVASDSIPSIAPGNFATVTFHWTATLGTGMVTEKHTFSAVVDGYNQIPETNEQNNEFAANLTVRDPRPDISFVGDVALNYTSENLTGGDEVNISFTLENTGAMNALVDVVINASLSNGTEYTLATISGLNVSANNRTAGYYVWTVDLAPDTYFISVIADPQNAINETNETNNMADNASLTIVPPVPSFGASPSITSGTDYNSGNVVTIEGTIINSLNGAALKGFSVRARLLDANGMPVTNADGNPVVYSGITSENGRYIINLLLPNKMKTGDYTIEVNADGVAQPYTAGTVHVQGVAGSLSWLYILLALVIVAAILIPMLWIKFFGKLGEMVECGACGALIPAGSKKCPKCGVEFETETAKCSVCGAWVPIDAPVCPECGAVFEAMTEEDEYHKKMHEEYEAEVLTPLKEKAKAEQGDEYDDEKFMEWATTQPDFISFDDWLAKREEEREKMIECPTCGTLNPPDAIVCQTCGSDLPREEPKPKKVKKKVKKQRPPEDAEKPVEEKKEEPGVALGLDDVLGTKVPEKKEEPVPRKVMKPASSAEEKTAAPTPTGETPKVPVRKVVKKPVQKRVVKKPVQADEKKE